MIVKMKFLSISGPKNDIDRVCEVYLSKYEMQLENAAAELKTTDNLQPFVEVNPYKEPLAKAEQFSALLADEDQRIDVSMNQEDMLNLIRDVNHDYLDLLEKKELTKKQVDEYKADHQWDWAAHRNRWKIPCGDEFLHWRTFRHRKCDPAGMRRILCSCYRVAVRLYLSVHRFERCVQLGWTRIGVVQPVCGHQYRSCRSALSVAGCGSLVLCHLVGMGDPVAAHLRGKCPEKGLASYSSSSVDLGGNRHCLGSRLAAVAKCFVTVM